MCMFLFVCVCVCSVCLTVFLLGYSSEEKALELTDIGFSSHTKPF